MPESGGSALVLGGAGHQAQVDDLGSAVVLDRDALRGQGAVHDADRVQRGESGADLLAPVAGPLPGLPAGGEDLAQGAAVDPLADRVAQAAVHAHVVDRGHAGVVDLGEPGDQRLHARVVQVRVRVGRRQPHRDRPGQPLVVPLPDLAVDRAADQPDELVPSRQYRTGLAQRHRSASVVLDSCRRRTSYCLWCFVERPSDSNTPKFYIWPRCFQVDETNAFYTDILVMVGENLRKTWQF